MSTETAKAVTTNLETAFLPPGFDWQHWVARYDRMQARYLVHRAERFALLVRMVRALGGPSARVVELGCGPGGLMEALLDAMPGAQVWGVDFDPTALLLARARLARHGERARVALADLRSPTWGEGLPAEVDAVISATALHWLQPAPLAALYRQVVVLLSPGGLFLNADHVGSDCGALQEEWERHREEMRAVQRPFSTRGGTGLRTETAQAGTMNGESASARADSSESECGVSESGEPACADDWDGFWAAYTAALGLEGAEDSTRRVLGGWDGGVEQGLPLAWHLDALREAGFGAVDCFWRCDCDAIYGGIKQGTRSFPKERVPSLPTRQGGSG
jgi:SAM-dependent methyltransferase